VAKKNTVKKEKKPKQKKDKKQMTPEEISRIMWMNSRNSYRHQVERSRPSWITSDDVLDGTNYIDPDDYYNPWRN
jgi:hypothetical protein